jgi:hypothetical protein
VLQQRLFFLFDCVAILLEGTDVDLVLQVNEGQDGRHLSGREEGGSKWFVLWRPCICATDGHGSDNDEDDVKTYLVRPTGK